MEGLRYLALTLRILDLLDLSFRLEDALEEIGSADRPASV